MFTLFWSGCPSPCSSGPMSGQNVTSQSQTWTESINVSLGDLLSPSVQRRREKPAVRRLAIVANSLKWFLSAQWTDVLCSTGHNPSSPLRISLKRKEDNHSWVPNHWVIEKITNHAYFLIWLWFQIICVWLVWLASMIWLSIKSSNKLQNGRVIGDCGDHQSPIKSKMTLISVCYCPAWPLEFHTKFIHMIWLMIEFKCTIKSCDFCDLIDDLIWLQS